MTHEHVRANNNDYFRRLETQEQRGRLLAETVSADSRAVMIEQVVSPELQNGLYVEVGFGADPYPVKTSRVFTESSRYVGMDGGVSEYYVPDHYGWGAENGPYRAGVWKAASKKFGPSDNAPHALLVRADAQHMPLPDAAKVALPVREIYLSDVLITPGVHHHSQLRIFKECARVIDPNGYLIIRESDMNLYTRGRQLALVAALAQAGFNRRVWVNDDPDIPRHQLSALAKQFGQSDPYDTYIIAQLGEDVSPPARWGRLGGWLHSLLDS